MMARNGGAPGAGHYASGPTTAHPYGEPVCGGGGNWPIITPRTDTVTCRRCRKWLGGDA